MIVMRRAFSDATFVMLQSQIDPELYRHLRVCAVAADTTMSEIVEQALLKSLPKRVGLKSVRPAPRVTESKEERARRLVGEIAKINRRK